jgi:hypothetical protein
MKTNLLNHNKYLSVLLLIVLIIKVQAEESIIRYLSGTGADHTVSWDFFCNAGRNSQQWAKIDVPSCWEQQGYGEYNYGHVPFEKRLNEDGIYKYEFDGLPQWKEKQIDIVFEGVMTDCEVILNKQLIGNHQGAFYEFSFDVSDVIQIGKKNLLEVKVKKFSDNDKLNLAELKADYWVFGGIFRPVYLQINPKDNIERVAIDAKADGSFKSDVILRGAQKASFVKVLITDFNGKKKAVFQKEIGTNSDSIRIEGVFKNPKLWSPEYPNRYIATFKLFDKSNKELHQLSKKIGFRTVEVRAEDGIYVNGVKTKFKGVNSHTFHPDFGRTSSERLSIQTVNLIKDMNMNAIRFSHYPHDKHLLNACDSLGLYVINELAGWSQSYDTELGRKLVREMIIRDVNNPSIVLWANGNEGGWNTDLDKDFTELDIQKREVIHPWKAFGKTITSHYIRYNYLVQNDYNSRQIFFPTEFLHGLYDGGHGAGLEDFWQIMWNNPLCAGGFLWVLADEAIKRTDNGKFDTDGNHAPDGIVGPYLQKEGSYYAIKEIWSPIFMEDRFITAQFNGQLNIENRFQFTSLKECMFEYRWVKFSSDGKKEITYKGIPEVPNLKPFEKGVLNLLLPENWIDSHSLEIAATDPSGREIYTWTYPVTTPKEITKALLDTPEAQGLTFSETDSVFTFSTRNGMKIRIGKQDGLLKSVSTKKGDLPFSNGPIIIGNEDKAAKITHTMEGNTHKVSVNYGNNKHTLDWMIVPNGLITLDINYEPKRQTYLAGVDFSLPEPEMEKVIMMSNGPYPVWKNRLKGVELGVWEKAYNNTIVGFSGYEYPEFKGYYSNLYWAQIFIKGNRSFKVYSTTNDLFLKLYNPAETDDPEKTKVEHSKGDISFMNGIPAIGTKFHSPENLGPRSLPYFFQSKRDIGGKIEIKLIFDFSEARK